MTASASVPTTVQRAVRTGIAAAVGFVAAFLLNHFGLHLSSANEATAVSALTAVFATAYNALALYLEKKYAWARWLLARVGN